MSEDRMIAAVVERGLLRSRSTTEDLYIVDAGVQLLDVAVVGATGHSLARMVLAGLPVPATAILGTQVYRRHAARVGDGRTPGADLRGRGRAGTALVSAAGVTVDLRLRRATIGGRESMGGDEIPLDGDSGRVFAGTVSVDEKRPTASLATVAAWATGDEPG